MRIVKIVLKFLFAVFFIVAGIRHFTHEDFYMKIMPDYIPLVLHRPAVIVSGVAEVLLGVLLVIPRTQTLAAWGLIALLIAIFPANIYAYQHQELIPEFGPTAHLIRLPLQAVMILWAWWYTTPDAPKVGFTPPKEFD